MTGPDLWHKNPEDWSVRYHVPRNQVFEGSRGRQSGAVHLHLPIVPGGRRTFLALAERKSTIERKPGEALCKRDAWYDRDPIGTELEPSARCVRCVAIATRFGIEWPTTQGEPTP
jgi:hypothetical protein